MRSVRPPARDGAAARWKSLSPGVPRMWRKFPSACATTSWQRWRLQSCWWAASSLSDFTDGYRYSVWDFRLSLFFVALTTAVGFLALVLSGSMGFSQLGVLIAIGIFVAGLFMCSIVFLFVRERQPPVRHDWIFEVVRKYVRWSVQRPAPI